MKRLLYYSLVVLVCIACGEDQGDRALVSGTIKGLTNDTLIIYGADQMFDHLSAWGHYRKYVSKMSIDSCRKIQ